MILFSHPTGNQNVRGAAYGLARAGLLGGFRTTVASFPGTILEGAGKLGALGELNKRSYDIALKNLTKTWGFREVGRMLASKAHLSRLTAHEQGFFSIDAVYQDLDRHVARELTRHPGKFNGAYAYEDGAALTFKQAKKNGIKCFYDLPIGYWRAARKLLEEERLKWPGFASTLTGFKDSPEKLKRKEEELRLADVIFVASSFTASTLNDYPGALNEIKVIPYGFPPVATGRVFNNFNGSRKLKLLFVGGLSQRKGIADLFKAVEPLRNKIELTVVGARPAEACLALDEALAKHTWIASLPHSNVLSLMQASDILVFPSLFEGFGLVITEAMSQGTPVITTNRTAGPDVITDGKNGWLVDAGSAAALYEKIDYLLSNPGLVGAAGRQALHAASLRSWNKYGEELAEAVRAAYN